MDGYRADLTTELTIALIALVIQWACLKAWVFGSSTPKRAKAPRMKS